METEEDQQSDRVKFQIKNAKDLPLLNFPNHIHYHCMRCLFLVDPEKLDSKLVRFIHLLFTWLEENAITGTRMNKYYDDRYSTIKNKDIQEVLDFFRQKNNIPKTAVQLDRLSNTHVIMLWKNSSL